MFKKIINNISLMFFGRPLNKNEVIEEEITFHEFLEKGAIEIEKKLLFYEVLDHIEKNKDDYNCIYNSSFMDHYAFCVIKIDGEKCTFYSQKRLSVKIRNRIKDLEKFFTERNQIEESRKFIENNYDKKNR